jgi:hypothetical protein
MLVRKSIPTRPCHPGLAPHRLAEAQLEDADVHVQVEERQARRGHVGWSKGAQRRSGTPASNSWRDSGEMMMSLVVVMVTVAMVRQST